MSLFPLRYLWLLLLLSALFPNRSIAQKPTFDTYRIRVVTKEGDRFRGPMDDIDNSYLYLRDERIPLARIRKVVIRSNTNKPMLVTGAIVGALAIGYLANQSLRTNQTRSPVAHGLTVTFAAAGGAAVGLLLGSAASRINHKVIRPVNQGSPETSLVRQLEPFTLRYQEDILNRLPKIIQ
ncbi:hypothetical protein BH09BAC4_BH09BAC4_40920 [soil metagenome]